MLDLSRAIGCTERLKTNFKAMARYIDLSPDEEKCPGYCSSDRDGSPSLPDPTMAGGLCNRAIEEWGEKSIH